MSVASVDVVHRFETPTGPKEWHNRWEIDLGVLGFWANDLSVIAQAFGTFHRNLLNSAFTVDRVVIGTYVQDGTPYDPDTFHVEPIGLAGIGGTPEGSALLPLSDVLFVRKRTVRGRPGKLYLRGFLQTNVIESDAGGVTRIKASANLQSAVATQFSTLVGSLGTVKVALASGAGPDNVREVDMLQVAGLAQRKTRRAVKPVAPAASPFRQMADFIGDLQGVAEVMNPIITAYNALPFPDVPLLGD